jgi:hypothetical protein
MDSNASYIPKSPIIQPSLESDPSLTTEASYQSNSIYNNPNYKLEHNLDSSSYLISEGLFFRDLLPYIQDHNREVAFKCTM